MPIYLNITHSDKLKGQMKTGVCICINQCMCVCVLLGGLNLSEDTSQAPWEELPCCILLTLSGLLSPCAGFKKEMYVNPVNLAACVAVIHVVVFVEPGEPCFTWLIASYFTSALPPGPEAPPPFI